MPNKTDMTDSDLARFAYQAYADFTDGKNFMGNDMPLWEDLPQTIRDAWKHVVVVLDGVMPE